MDKNLNAAAFSLAAYKKVLQEVDARFENLPAYPEQNEPGPEGPQGITGAQGSQGVPGNKGNIGPQGTQGTIGQDGRPGAQGAAGATGDSGTQGTMGLQGVAGRDGQKGTAGRDGIQGVVGPQGATGEVGKQGAIGPQGVKGVDGIQGSVGRPGDKGPQGSIGPQGTAGVQGKTGQDGKQGIQGAMGAQGPAGPVAEIPDIEPHVDGLRKEFNAYRMNLNARLSTLGGGGSYKLLDNSDVEQQKLSQVTENAILIYNPNKKKFVLSDIEAVITSLGLEVGGVTPQYNRLIDVEGNTTYVGEALPGTGTNQAKWRIKRIVEDSEGDTEILWAGGDAGFINTWDNRLTYSYS